MSGHGECVGTQRGLDLGVVEVDDGSVVFDHVHFLNAGNGVYLKETQETEKGMDERIYHLMLLHYSRLTESFLRDDCSFLSSVVAVRWTTFFFLRADPFPPMRT